MSNDRQFGLIALFPSEHGPPIHLAWNAFFHDYDWNAHLGQLGLPSVSNSSSFINITPRPECNILIAIPPPPIAPIT